MTTVAADLSTGCVLSSARCVDPEIPVLTIGDLGVLRDVAVEDGRRVW